MMLGSFVLSSGYYDAYYLKALRTKALIKREFDHAFEKYDEILNTLKKESKNTLIIIALGPTATVLAYDLAKDGYQALDMGHFDIEYEWYLRNATKKEKISNKYTNEVSGGNDTENVNDKNYTNQIKTIIK